MTVDQMRMVADHRQMMADRTRDGRMTSQQMTLNHDHKKMLERPNEGHDAVVRLRHGW